MSVRFAPSPTGRFHIGNLRTGWVSHAWARALNVPWVVRFEDIDAPRNIPGAVESQLADMKLLGLVPDVISHQSARRARHYELFQKAISENLLYPCVCSRKDVQRALAGIASAPHAPVPVYDGHCRGLTGIPDTNNPSIAWRFRDADPSGRHDFIAARTAPDGSEYTPAYHWACAIDDADDKHQLLVRAWDLESAVIPQHRIQAWMRATPPACFHASLVIRDDGARLEKRMRGIFLDELWITPAEVVKRFEKTFRPDPKEFRPGRLWGEPEKEIPVGKLLS